jgi:hypothetical protein
LTRQATPVTVIALGVHPLVFEGTFL